jgi:hypothetical protein
MMKFFLNFDMDNDSFKHYPEGEIARILNDIAADILNGTVEGRILDYNGNFIGKYEIEVKS